MDSEAARLHLRPQAHGRGDAADGDDPAVIATVHLRDDEAGVGGHVQFVRRVQPGGVRSRATVTKGAGPRPVRVLWPAGAPIPGAPSQAEAMPRVSRSSNRMAAQPQG